MKKQPARKSYVFEGAYQDIRRTFGTLWGQMIDRDSMKKMFSNILLFIPSLIVFIVITAIRLVLNTLISAVLLIAFLFCAPFVCVGFLSVSLLDLIYRLLHRIRSICPKCQQKYDLPTYICPACGAHHTRLIPSSYGIFKRTCECGTKIPTTFFNGRQRLRAVCPNTDPEHPDDENRSCGFVFIDGGKSSDFCIPVVGGPSAGKTCFINAAIQSLGNDSAIRDAYRYEYIDNGLNEHLQIVEDMKHGSFPEKSKHYRLQFYQFYLTPKTADVNRVLSVCDVAGEAYEDTHSLTTQVAFRHAGAFIFVVDPLAIEEYRDELKQTRNPYRYSPSDAPLDVTLNVFANAVANFYSLSSKAKIKVPMAVVFTKCDIPELDVLIGETAVREQMRLSGASASAACAYACENFLERYGEGNFVQTLKRRFETVSYFTCSAVSDLNGPLYADSLKAPLIWAIDQATGAKKKRR